MLSRLSSYLSTWLWREPIPDTSEESDGILTKSFANPEYEVPDAAESSTHSSNQVLKDLSTDASTDNVNHEYKIGPSPTPAVEERTILVECSNRACQEPGTKVCSGCRALYYCSKHCQSEDWDAHVWNCNLPIHTGHYLRKACLQGTPPTDLQTRIDYGFERAGAYRSLILELNATASKLLGHYLLGLYQDLWRIKPKLTSKELNRWRKNGLLVLKIKETFESIPEQDRGYYPWFLRNQWILDEYGDGVQSQAGLMENRAWHGAGEDLNSDVPRWSEGETTTPLTPNAEESTHDTCKCHEYESPLTPDTEQKNISTGDVVIYEHIKQPAPTSEAKKRKMSPQCSNSLSDCEEPGARYCSGCKAAYYCSVRCQTEHWEFHVWECRVPIHTGHYLRKACSDNIFPIHHQTRIDYGFERAGPYCSKLLGLYQGLWYINPELTSKELNRWRKNGLLISKIKETFESVPAQDRGGYYPCFLRNQWILDGSPIPNEDCLPQQEESDQMIKNAWVRIGKDLSSEMPRWSKAKNDCFTHYATILSGYRPHPSTDIWVHGGYCAANDYRMEFEIGRLYTELFECCSFEDYWAAYDSASVFTLMEKYQILPYFWGIPFINNLRIILSSPTMHQSVWYLNQSINEGLEVFQPGCSVALDYGFINCTSIAEEEALVDIYRAAFRCRDFDGMKLHEACIQGKIFGYVTQFVPVKKKGEIRMMKRLMQNPYPLRT